MHRQEHFYSRLPWGSLCLESVVGSCRAGVKYQGDQVLLDGLKLQLKVYGSCNLWCVDGHGSVPLPSSSDAPAVTAGSAFLL